VTSKERKIIDTLKNGGKKEHVNMLYDFYFPKIRNYIMKNSGSMDDALDVFHDTVLIFHRQIIENKIDKYDKLEGFLFVTAKNVWISNRTKEINRHQREAKFAEDKNSYSFLEKMENSERISMVKATFNLLGEKCKELLNLTILTDIPMEEISDRLGYSSGSVAKTLNYRCKKKLQDLIKKTPGLTSFLTK
jgi:RNA polymerase sigma factor (sigma-70 family)